MLTSGMKSLSDFLFLGSSSLIAACGDGIDTRYIQRVHEMTQSGNRLERGSELDGCGRRGKEGGRGEERERKNKRARWQGTGRDNNYTLHRNDSMYVFILLSVPFPFAGISSSGTLLCQPIGGLSEVREISI